ncbi:hypothetical protein J5J86_23085 [Aquabacter sp. L1I39]|uniref:DUF4114 domain-containing protein n=1 Tax=Aquabacter sp. L1I39 TaxID=2820278 RepID=UPI001ADC87CF|nr:S53 family peptidase [Aquabacter sp. L1I39]QTL03575.1 hypothetical protein J5J86_23085 [Aquabacter sp. L1I39]
MSVLENSGYLDFTSWGTTTATSVQQAYGFDPANIQPYLGTAPIYNVALILPRANDPTALLQSDWATRQSTIAQMEADGTLWTTYGADPATYDAAVAALTTMGISILGDADATGGHVSSAASRTIWVSLTPAQFSQLFGTQLLMNDEAGNFRVFYEGDLSLPADIPATGLYIEGAYGAAVEAQTGTSVNLQPGPQSEGNSSTASQTLPPQDIADLYHLPLTGNAAVDGTVALVEPVFGSAMPTGSTLTLDDGLASYLSAIHVTGAPQTYTVANGGQEFPPGSTSDERSMDVGVVAAINPYSTIGIYAGSGLSGGSTFSTYQGIIWDLAHDPSVLSSSFGDVALPAPDSPFFAAFQDLYVDAALRGLSVFIASGDGGSGGEQATGLPNFQAGSSSPYVTLVGGTSMSLVPAAEADATLAGLLAAVEAQDLDTLRMLVEGGLTMAPTALNAYNALVETVWNQYDLRSSGLFPGYLVNATGAGAVDTRLPIPSYQDQYGLTPTNPMGQTGRGLPDVSANSGGNLSYLVPSYDFSTTTPDGGTSASAPFWAALALQVNTIFEAQLLPNLGMSNDLLYIASAIAPGAFNDVQLGNNISTYVAGGTLVTDTRGGGTTTITPTGLGYEAEPGYDLTTGLGTPNGTLLARALATIGQTQMHPHATAVLEDTGDGIHYVSGATQSLIVQSSLAQATTFGLTVDGHASTFAGAMGDAYAWNAAFAQKALQANFAPELVTLFDRQAQGTITQMEVAAGAHLSVDIGGAALDGDQVDLTADYGFGSFAGTAGAVEVARAVAVASTAGGLDDQTAIVRLRQNGVFDLEVQFYKVDDLSGTIAGLTPGSAGYAAAAQARAYLTEDGDTWVEGAGYGAYSRDLIYGVDAGDLIAMRLFNGSETFWAFAGANEKVSGQSVAHLMGYGLNTWGWEDTFGGGDHDYNDLVVQLDFSSAYTAASLGNAPEWLA